MPAEHRLRELRVRVTIRVRVRVRVRVGARVRFRVIRARNQTGIACASPSSTAPRPPAAEPTGAGPTAEPTGAGPTAEPTGAGAPAGRGSVGGSFSGAGCGWAMLSGIASAVIATTGRSAMWWINCTIDVAPAPVACSVTGSRSRVDEHRKDGILLANRILWLI